MSLSLIINFISWFDQHFKFDFVIKIYHSSLIEWILYFDSSDTGFLSINDAITAHADTVTKNENGIISGFISAIYGANIVENLVKTPHMP